MRWKLALVIVLLTFLPPAVASRPDALGPDVSEVDPLVAAGVTTPACATALGVLQRLVLARMQFDTDLADALDGAMRECDAVHVVVPLLNAAPKTCAIPTEEYPRVTGTMTIVVNGTTSPPFNQTFNKVTVTMVDAGAYTETYYGNDPATFGLFGTNGGLGQVYVRGAAFAADGQASIGCTDDHLCPGAGAATASFPPLLFVTVTSSYVCEQS